MPDGSRELVLGVYAHRHGRRWVVLMYSGNGQWYTSDPSGGGFTGLKGKVLGWAKRWGNKYASLAKAYEDEAYSPTYDWGDE